MLIVNIVVLRIYENNYGIYKLEIDRYLPVFKFWLYIFGQYIRSYYYDYHFFLLLKAMLARILSDVGGDGCDCGDDNRQK